MQDLPRDEGAVNVAVGALDVPAIGAERAQADSTEEVRPLPAKEEAEEDEPLGSHMVECAKLTHEWVEVSPFAALLLRSRLVLGGVVL